MIPMKNDDLNEFKKDLKKFTEVSLNAKTLPTVIKAIICIAALIGLISLRSSLENPWLIALHAIGLIFIMIALVLEIIPLTVKLVAKLQDPNTSPRFITGVKVGGIIFSLLCFVAAVLVLKL